MKNSTPNERAKKAVRYLVNETRKGRYVRAWWVGRDEIAVQVWNGPDPVGEPAGDWGMPSVLGVEASVDQAMLQTPPK